MVGRWWTALGSYLEHEDPRVAMASLVAVVVVWNQPFYPLYVWWVAGPEIGPSWYTFLSTPFFAAVPFVARRSGLAARLLLLAAGIGNTLSTTKVFGLPAGVEVFFIPCALLGVVLFGPRERWIGLAVAGFCLAAFLGLRDAYGDPVHVYSAEQYAALLSMNAVSAGCLAVFVGLLASSRMRER